MSTLYVRAQQLTELLALSAGETTVQVTLRSFSHSSSSDPEWQNRGGPLIISSPWVRLVLRLSEESLNRLPLNL